MDNIKEEKVETATDFRENLGIRKVLAEEGYAKAEMIISPSHLNVHGILHGGCIFSLADTTSGMAVVSFGHSVTTVTGNINYLRPGKDTKKLTAAARVVKHGRTFTVCNAEVFDDKESLIATTTMTFYHLPE